MSHNERESRRRGTNHVISGTGRSDTGIVWYYRDKPIAVKYLKQPLSSGNGEVKIIKPADPEKIRAYREAEARRKKGTYNLFNEGTPDHPDVTDEGE